MSLQTTSATTDVRVIRCSNAVSVARVKSDSMTVPLRLVPSWNKVSVRFTFLCIRYMQPQRGLHRRSYWIWTCYAGKRGAARSNTSTPSACTCLQTAACEGTLHSALSRGSAAHLVLCRVFFSSNICRNRELPPSLRLTLPSSKRAQAEAAGAGASAPAGAADSASAAASGAGASTAASEAGVGTGVGDEQKQGAGLS